MSWFRLSDTSNLVTICIAVVFAAAILVAVGRILGPGDGDGPPPATVTD